MTGQSTSTFNCAWTYDDVVLSFLGRDTRHGFTGNLYKALHDKGIHTTFMDDEELQSGEEINPSLLYAIRKSRIAIIVLSKNYASSSFCLDELSAILDLVKGNGRLVLPVFYEVDPSDVRHHRGTYGEALVKHEERFKAIEGTMKRLQKWKVALNQVGTLSGWHFKQHGNEYELKFIERIVEFVCSIILPYSSHVADYPDGFSSRVLEVNTLLELGSDGVQMVGIYGFIGIGKTTLARAIYSLIADQFEGTYFLENVRENSRKHGLVYLQETLFHKIVGEKDTRLAHVNEGISRIKHCLNQKKVLLILDDVDRLEQLQAIVGGRDWFGSGSRVIITTRNRELLACHGVERTYEVNGLNEREALELFTLHAFRDAKVDPSYDDILKRLVMYASSIPLTLKIIGSKLFGRNVEEWKYALEHYKINPPREIQQVLRLSFDDLDEDVREIFLDIACFFKGCRLEDVEDVLCAHHDFITKYALRVLVDSSLIKIRDDLVSLHDLVEQVGREIVRQESPKDPGKRSRLWFHEDIIEVLKDDEGSSKIQTIMLDFPDVRKAIAWNGKAFKKMNNLRTLIIRNGCSDVDVEHLPNSLRVLEWREYPSSSLPSDFHPEELTILKLSYSGLASLDFLKTHKFTSLRVLEFDGSERILEIYYVSGVPNLEKLSFRYCKNLFQIDESVGFLKKLRVLDADGCSKLRRFPPIMLTSLQHLNLSHCSSLERFPEILGVMENITELHLEGTPIRELPFSIQYLTQLEELYLKNCGLREIRWIPPKLETLSVVCCTSLKYLVLLNLCGTGSTCSLRTLILDGCKDLEKIRGIPPNIERLSALNCTSLTHSFRSMLLNQVSREAGSMVLTLPGSRIPEWFEHVSIAEPISFWFRDMFPAISLCAVITLEDDSSTPFHVHPKLNINGNAMNNYFISDHLLIEADHICIFDDIQSQFSENVNEVILENEWNYAEIWVHAAFVSDRSQLAIQTGLHVFKQKGSMEDIQFSNPYEIARDDERDSCSMVSTQISSSTNVKGLQEIHHLTSIIQQDFGGRESVNEGKGKGILACNSSSDGEKIYRSPSLELLPTTMEYEVTSEKDQHASNDESMTRDPEHQRSGQWQFSLWGLIFSVVSLCCSSFSLSAR